MKEAMEKLSLLARDRTLLKRIGFTVLALIIFRVLANIPIPGVNVLNLQALFANSQFGQFFGLVNIFSGGGLSRLSIVMLGVGPYITASIIMQLLTVIFPRLKEMYQEEGDVGRKKFATYTRWITLPLAFLQGLGFLKLLQSQQVLGDLTWFGLISNAIVVTAGSFFLVWIGELISEFGIGNGSSVIIFAGIVASLPLGVVQTLETWSATQIPTYVALIVVAIVVIAGVVFISEAERPVPVTYAKRVRGNKIYGGISTYLPIRLNQAGVIPIIFALSLLLFPQVLSNILLLSHYTLLQTISRWVLDTLQNNWIYAALYFVLVFAFTYFYTAVTFDPQQIATNLQKNGAFVPGVRPGDSTSLHLSNIITRLTLVGALFLGVIAVLPILIRAFTNITTFTVGGTAILIVVSVVLDILKKADAQLTAKEY